MLGLPVTTFTVAAGAVLGGVEATPKIWDLAGAWVILHASWRNLGRAAIAIYFSFITWERLQQYLFPLSCRQSSRTDFSISTLLRIFKIAALINYRQLEIFKNTPSNYG
ncbi:MAG: hypothetical protein CLLPBCKN_000589 [Chroococcidiopsis cubana SAG 39.79]|nr:hypothetical protein [Chroococcidiopsis cubana SAG 39.79]